MSTTKKLGAGSMLAVAALVLILIAIGVGRPAGPSQATPADAPWSDPLTQLQEQEARAERAADASSQRLSGLAAIDFPGIDEFAPASVGTSDRAVSAWADRLSGLAEYYAAQK